VELYAVCDLFWITSCTEYPFFEHEPQISEPQQNVQNFEICIILPNKSWVQIVENVSYLSLFFMLNVSAETGALGARAASCYGSGFFKIMWFLATRAPAVQQWY
jgi:hypothetical protein